MRREDVDAGVGEGRVPAYDAGCGGGWVECGPCHKQRFLRYAPPEALVPKGSAGCLLHAACNDLLASEAFGKWLLGVTELAPRGMRAEVRRFRPGLDYTVATGGGLGAAAQLEATLCFVDAGSEDKAAAWGSDEVGGFQCYILADDEAMAAAETYRYSSLFVCARACLLHWVGAPSVSSFRFPGCRQRFADVGGDRGCVSAHLSCDLCGTDMVGIALRLRADRAFCVWLRGDSAWWAAAPAPDAENGCCCCGSVMPRGQNARYMVWPVPLHVWPLLPCTPAGASPQAQIPSQQSHAVVMQGERGRRRLHHFVLGRIQHTQPDPAGHVPDAVCEVRQLWRSWQQVGRRSGVHHGPGR